MKEAEVRVIIDKMLRSSRWVLPNDKGKVNVEMEAETPTGPADYLLRDSKGFAICIIEAKNSLKSPLDGKEQARRYAKSQNCRFAILSNGFTHYYWDINFGNPISIDNFPTQKELEYANGFNPDPKSFQSDKITVDYIAISQLPNYANDPDYTNDKLKDEKLMSNFPELCCIYIDIDNDEFSEICEKYDVQSLPTQFITVLKNNSVKRLDKIIGYNWNGLINSYIKNVQLLKNDQEIKKNNQNSKSNDENNDKNNDENNDKNNDISKDESSRESDDMDSNDMDSDEDSDENNDESNNNHDDDD